MTSFYEKGPPPLRMTAHLLLEDTEGLLAWREEDGVDDMDYAVRAEDVGLHDIRLVDLDLSALDHHMNIRTGDGLGLLDLDHVGGKDSTRNDVVREHLDQEVLVLRQRSEGGLGDLGEGGVGRSEDGERAVALQNVHESGIGQELGKGLELTGTDSGVNDVLLRLCEGGDAQGRHGDEGQQESV